MGCNNCNVTPCRCSPPAPYYTQTSMCPEDNTKNVYIQQYTLGLQIQADWNIPACGGAAILPAPGVTSAPIGEYLHNPQYGYFEIVAFDYVKEEITISNPCFEGNLPPGSAVPRCTNFIVTPYPCTCENNSSFSPYVAIDFTAPAVDTCIDITVTTINGLAVGDTVQIGGGSYVIDHFTGTNIVNICNEGEGITPGTPVIAKDAQGQYQYPIIVTASCCTTIITAIQTGKYIWGGTSTGSANAQTLYLQPPLVGPYEAGTSVEFIAGYTNTGNLTMNVDGIGAYSVVMELGIPVLPGQVVAGDTYRITFNGTNWTLINPSSANILDGSNNTIANSTTETSIFSTTIPGGYLGSDNALRYNLASVMHNSSGGTEGVTIKIKYGGTVVYQVTPSVLDSADDYDLPTQVILAGANAPNSQVTKGATTLTNMVSPPTAAVVSISASGVYISAIDSTSNQTFQVTVTLSTADPDLWIAVYSQLLEFIY